MAALARNIDISLRQQLGETKLSKPAQPVNGFLY